VSRRGDPTGFNATGRTGVSAALTAASAARAQKFGAAPPLVGLDGRPVDVGGDSALAGLESRARMNRQLSQWQETSYAEMSRLLTRLRSEYDALRLTNKQRQRSVADASGEMSRLETVMTAESERSKATRALDEEARSKDSAAMSARSRLEDEERRRHTLRHMTRRLKEQRTELNTDVSHMQEELSLLRRRSAEARLSLQTTRTERRHATALVDRLQAQLESDREQRAGKMEEVEVALEAQGDRRRAFDEREKRRLNIAHLPRGDLDEAGEDRLKQLFVVRRIYASMLERRLREDARRCDRLQAAFQRIRGVTGLTDTREIVAKFLRRDEAVAGLRSQLQTVRDRLESVRATRREAAWRLDQVAAAAGGGSGRKRAQYVSKDASRRRRADASRRCSERRERMERLTVMLEDCRACVAKLLTRLGIPVVAETAKVDLVGVAGPRDSGRAGVASAIVAAARAQGDRSAATAASGARTAAGSGVAGVRAVREDGDEGAARPSFDGRSHPPSPMATGAAAGLASPSEEALARTGELGRSPSRLDSESSRGDADGAGTGPAGPPGAVRVTLPTLDSALGQVETAVSRALAQLAAAMERDEVRATRQPARGASAAGMVEAHPAPGVPDAALEPEAADPSNVRVSARRKSEAAPAEHAGAAGQAQPRRPSRRPAGAGPGSSSPPDGSAPAMATSPSGQALSSAALRRIHRMLSKMAGHPGGPLAPGGGAAGIGGDAGEDDEEEEDLYTRHELKCVSAMLVEEKAGAKNGTPAPGSIAAREVARARKARAARAKQGAKHRSHGAGAAAAAAAAEAEAELQDAPTLGYVAPVATPRPQDQPTVVYKVDDARVKAAIRKGALNSRDASAQFATGEGGAAAFAADDEPAGPLGATAAARSPRA